MIGDHRVLSCCMIVSRYDMYVVFPTVERVIVSRYDMYVVFQTVDRGKDDW